MNYKLILASALLFTACKHTRKTTAASNPVTVKTTDTVKTTVTASETVALDPYQESNSRLNDLLHTKLEVSFDWKASRLNGKATLKLKPYFYPTEWLYLNARGMDIKKLEVFEVASVTENKKTGNKTTQETVDIWHVVATSTYKYENDSLKVHLGKIFNANQPYFVVIDYVAKPNELKEGGSQAITDDKGLYFINPDGANPFKMPQVWTQGETQASSAWFPTIDSPNERTTQEIYMTVDDKYTTLSNGYLASSVKNTNGTRTDHWKLDEPHAPYLAMMAAGEFVKVTDEPWNGKEISYYVEKEYAPHAKAIFGDTREMIDFYSRRLGVPYAWPKYAQIAVRDYVSGAMENTSSTLHGDFMVYQTTRETLDEKKGNAVIAHELFHQWFGDLVTCESWSNLPLNESFATYGEYLWEEYKFGRDAADYHHWQSRQGYLHSETEKEIVRYRYKDKEEMFDAFSYNKGGQVLHMLRKAVGDDGFFASLNHYLTQNRFKSVEIHNLRLSFEEVTGRDLSWFFNQWFLAKGRPQLNVSYGYADGNVELTVKQTQDLKKVPLYKLPLEVDIYVNGKPQRTHITVTDTLQRFRIPSSVKPELVNFDAERQLLCDLQYRKSTEEYVYQYKNAPLYDDRHEALKKLDSMITDEKVFNVFTSAATGDKFYALRNYAISRLEKAADARKEQTKATLITIFKNDPKTLTRARALTALNSKFGQDADVKQLNEQALNEQSYAICGEALQALTKTDPKLAMEKAKQLEKEPGKDVLFPIAVLYGAHGSDDQISFFHNSLKHFTTFEIMSFCASYVKTAKRCEKPESARLVVGDLELLLKGANKYAKFSMSKGIKDLLGVWESREKKALSAVELARKENRLTPALEAELKAATDTKEFIARSLSNSRQ
jgi:aminopeptidase N